MLTPFAAHADWSVDAGKRWMALATPEASGWAVHVAPVGSLATLLMRLRAWAGEAPLALGVDFPIGLPRNYAARHAAGVAGFPAFLRALAETPAFFQVCASLEDVCAARPFYPMHGVRGMTRLSHAQALGMDGAAGLSRACDRATADRPAGAPLFWTLGANQVGKAAITGWRDLLLPALAGPAPPALWPFDGALLPLLAPGRTVVAECYPAEAMRQLGVTMGGSKRRQADRQVLGPALHVRLAALDARPDPALAARIGTGFGPAPSGEDAFDCLLGLLGMLGVLTGRRADTVPDDPWVRRWEGWVLGQSVPAYAR